MRVSIYRRHFPSKVKTICSHSLGKHPVILEEQHSVRKDFWFHSMINSSHTLMDTERRTHARREELRHGASESEAFESNKDTESLKADEYTTTRKGR